jgi:phosphate starvation-inducible protein PhoH
MFWKFIVMGAPSKVDLKETVGIAKLKEVFKAVKEADGGAGVDK